MRPEGIAVRTSSRIDLQRLQPRIDGVPDRALRGAPRERLRSQSARLHASQLGVGDVAGRVRSSSLGRPHRPRPAATPFEVGGSEPAPRGVPRRARSGTQSIRGWRRWRSIREIVRTAEMPSGRIGAGSTTWRRRSRRLRGSAARCSSSRRHALPRRVVPARCVGRALALDAYVLDALRSSQPPARRARSACSVSWTRSGGGGDARAGSGPRR